MIETLWKIQGGAFTKQLISQLLSVQEFKTWFENNAKTPHAHKMNNLIHIIKNIDENMRNSRQIEGK